MQSLVEWQDMQRFRQDIAIERGPGGLVMYHLLEAGDARQRPKAGGATFKVRAEKLRKGQQTRV